MTEKTLSEKINDLINSSPMLEDSKLETLREVSLELERQDKIIDFLYEALGPANDEILDMAYEAADAD